MRLNVRSFCDKMVSQPQTVALAMLEASQGVTPVLEVLMHSYSNLPLFSLQEETKEIPLTQSQVAIVSACDYDWLMQWKWCATKNRGGIWYAKRTHGPRNQQKYLLMHRVIMDAPQGMMVDHVNGDGLDNRRSNLRFATNQQNQFNSKKQRNNTSGYKGVYWRKDKGGWQAQIHVSGKHRHIGYFANAEDAARAYDAIAKEMHGEFAHLNFWGNSDE